MKPDRRSSKESKVEAIIASEPLRIEAYTLAVNNAMFAMFDSRMAKVSLRATLSRSSCKRKEFYYLSWLKILK
jgi:hypothetical protein